LRRVKYQVNIFYVDKFPLTFAKFVYFYMELFHAKAAPLTTDGKTHPTTRDCAAEALKSITSGWRRGSERRRSWAEKLCESPGSLRYIKESFDPLVYH
jgi:hypothetical protein